MSRSPAPVNPVSMAAVAARAGVSVATVSRVLNHQEGVTGKTQAKVNRAVEELGYRVNQLANSLRTARSWLLLIMVPDLGNPFYIEIVRGIDRVARQHGYFVLLCDTGADLAGSARPSSCCAPTEPTAPSAWIPTPSSRD
ncbi:LacI family DNA-binding transcriptional regulator [Aeromonas rivipollensis]